MRSGSRPAVTRWSCLLAVFLVFWHGPVGANEPLRLWLGGVLHQAELVENGRLASVSPDPEHRKGRHYRGRLADVADSWVRLSRVAGEWRGVVSAFGELHRVAGPVGGEPLQPRPVVEALRELDFEPRCGSPHRASALESTDDSSAAEVLTSPTAAAASVAELCSSQVDGVCLVPELEMVFDAQFQGIQFQGIFGANAEDQALTLLNIVEGYYREDLGLAFDTLSMTFPDTELFNDSRNAVVFLGESRGIAGRKNSLPFLQNPRAIFHVVTGRNFEGGTVGLAYVDTLCDNDGFSSGTSQVLDNDIVLTAVVVAHEIGHNMGAIHDGDEDSARGIDNTCDSTAYIMSGSVATGSPPDSFSHCSVDEINGTINALGSSLDQCFKFPVDVGISAGSGNPERVDETTGATLDLYFDISYQQAGRAADGIRVNGEVEAGDGTLLEAELNGSACSLGEQQLGFRCTGSTQNPQTLRVQVRVTGAQLRLEQIITASGADVIDMDASNDSLSLVLPSDLLPAPSQLTLSEADQDLRLQWRDNGDSETGHVVERQRDGDDPWQVVASLPADTETWLDTNVERTVLYRYRVFAEDGEGLSQPSNTVEGGIDLPQPKPQPVADSGSSAGVILLWWLPLLFRRLRSKGCA